jgi:hypothetical protein
MPCRVGIDVGGTKCLGVRLGDDLGVVTVELRPTPGDPEELVDTLCELSLTLGPADTLGIGVPGLVTREGVLRAAPHITEVADLPLRTLLEDRLQRPVSEPPGGRPTRSSSRSGPASGARSSPVASSSAAPTGSRARSGTWSSIPTGHRALVAAEGAGSASRPARR